MSTAHDVARFFGQCSEVAQRISRDQLDPEVPRRALQEILDPSQVASRVGPVWHRSPESWLKEAQRLNKLAGGDFVKGDFPKAPPYYVPSEPGAMLGCGLWLPDKAGVDGLIRTLRLYLEALPVPSGWTKESFIDLDEEHVGLVQGLEYRPGIRWFEYLPYRLWNPAEGFCVDQAREAEAAENLATIEPLVMLNGLEPYRDGIDGVNTPFPDMPGLEYGSKCPCVDRDPGLRQFWLDALLSRSRPRAWAPVVVRELEVAA